MATLRALRLLLVALALAPAAGRLFHARAPVVPRAKSAKPPSDALGARLSRAACHALYLASAINPVLSVLSNEYVTWSKWNTLKGVPRVIAPKNPKINKVYSTLFYFARLKPRLLFVAGAALRALQQTTVLQLFFEPSVGVGAGLNMLALFADSRWPAPLFLGWAASRNFWLALGARPPSDAVALPIDMKVSLTK